MKNMSYEFAYSAALLEIYLTFMKKYPRKKTRFLKTSCKTSVHYLSSLIIIKNDKTY